MQGSTVMLQCWWREREREREVGRDVFPLQSSAVAQCPVLVTMLHFTSYQIISLFSPVRNQPGGPNSVAAFRPEEWGHKTWMDSRGGGGGVISK